MRIACAFRGVITSVGVSLLGVAHPYGKIFQVQGIHRWTTLIQGREIKESQLVVVIVLFVKLWKKTSFGIYLYM